MARRVDLKDQSPLIIKAEDLVNGSCAVCRCGLSGNWPYCNGTHKATKGEDPDKLYRYERELPQGTVRRIEIGDLETPGERATDAKAGQPEAGVHDGAGEHRPRRPERGVLAEGTHGNEAGAEPDTVGDPEAKDELLAEPSPASEGGPKGGGEAVLPGGKNRSGQGGESA